jgi:hypothetical protein
MVLNASPDQKLRQIQTSQTSIVFQAWSITWSKSDYILQTLVLSESKIRNRCCLEPIL